MGSLAMLGFGGSSPPLSTKTLNKQYKDMENKETINENSFLGEVRTFAESMNKEVKKYADDKSRHRALVLLATDAEDGETIEFCVRACGNTKDILILLNELISDYVLPHQRMILDILEGCYERRVMRK